MERSCPTATREEIEIAGDERARWDRLVEALSTRYDGTGPGDDVRAPVPEAEREDGRLPVDATAGSR